MSGGQEADQRDPAENELLALEKAFTAALVAGDLNVLEGIIADGWAIVDPDGHLIDKTAFVAVLTSGDLAHTSMDLSEARVRVYGDTGLLTARVRSTGAYQGRQFATDERSTDVFVRVQGAWRCVFTQLTGIARK